jgi:hypothetical protein
LLFSLLNCAETKAPHGYGAFVYYMVCVQSNSLRFIILADLAEHILPELTQHLFIR